MSTNTTKGPAPEAFDKPVWTLRALAAAAPGLPGHLARALPTFVGRPISGGLRERIMLAVATANRCFYCRLAHGILGELSGLSREEVAALLAGEDAAPTERERLALRFARDLAARGFTSRDEALWERLGELWSGEERAAIESTAHFMNVANRFGNTFDALRARLVGRPLSGDAGALDLAVVSGVFVPVALGVAPVIAGAGVLVGLRRALSATRQKCLPSFFGQSERSEATPRGRGGAMEAEPD